MRTAFYTVAVLLLVLVQTYGEKQPLRTRARTNHFVDVVAVNKLAWSPTTTTHFIGDSVTFPYNFSNGPPHNAAATNSPPTFMCSSSCDPNSGEGNDVMPGPWVSTFSNFTVAQSIPFHCELHTNMKGVIVVKSASALLDANDKS